MEYDFAASSELSKAKAVVLIARLQIRRLSAQYELHEWHLNFSLKLHQWRVSNATESELM